jgi:hypothetical protein
MAAVKFSANKVLNLQKKCGNSSWVLMAEKKEFKVTYLKSYIQLSKKKLRIFR